MDFILPFQKIIDGDIMSFRFLINQIILCLIIR